MHGFRQQAKCTYLNIFALLLPTPKMPPGPPPPPAPPGMALRVLQMMTPTSSAVGASERPHSHHELDDLYWTGTRWVSGMPSASWSASSDRSNASGEPIVKWYGVGLSEPPVDGGAGSEDEPFVPDGVIAPASQTELELGAFEDDEAAELSVTTTRE